MAMEWRVEFSDVSRGPFEPLVRLSADTWPVAELELLAETGGFLFLGYYRVWTEEAAAATLYVWDGVTGAFRRLR